MGREKTPLGLSYYTWAPNKYAASASFIALLAAGTTTTTTTVTTAPAAADGQ